jgi:YidC/Oxa1 family membrane protein insertase
MVLACAVLFAWMKWFAPQPPAQVNPSEGTPGQTQESVQSSSTPTEASLPGSVFLKPISIEDSHNLQTTRLEASLSDYGGKISEIRLKDYREAVQKDSPLITLVGRNVSPFSLSALFSDPELEELGREKFTRSVEGDEIHFTRKTPQGVTLQKNYKFDDRGYALDATFKISFPNSKRRDWGYVAIPVGATSLQYDHNDPLRSWEVVFFQNDSVTRRISDKLEDGEKVLQGNTSWLAFGNRYFSTALVNKAQINPDVVQHKSGKFQGAYLRYPLILKEGQSSLEFPLKIYVGPKDSTELAKIPGLKQLIDYGIFSILAYPLLDLLRFFYRFLHNYGIAVILMTVLVRLVLYPLSLKSYRSMKSMQKLQPQLNVLKEKYKDDKEKFNREQIALFKAHKVNPAGGCLPIFLQLPIFIAFYAVLGNSIELFHAPFFGWIQDLSSRDPYYIFPVLMGISMFAQQRLTPNVGMDPMQQKMMYLMPLVFSFFMLKLPSGLTIYMFVSTLLGILQQVSMRDPASATAKLVPASPTGAPEKG